MNIAPAPVPTNIMPAQKSLLLRKLQFHRSTPFMVQMQGNSPLGMDAD